MNILITPFDGVLAEVTTKRPGWSTGTSIDITDNFYFGIGSTIFLTVVITMLVHRIVEPRLGTYTGTVEHTDAQRSTNQRDHQACASPGWPCSPLSSSWPAGVAFQNAAATKPRPARSSSTSRSCTT